MASLIGLRPKEKDPFLGKTISGARLNKLLTVRPTRRIYRAMHLETRAGLRVEVFPTEFVDLNMDYVRELLTSAAVTNELRSIYVTTILDMGRRRDCCFIVCPFEPSSLRSLLAKKGRLEIRRALAFAEDILRGLVAVEEAGAMHGNVTPDGVLLGHDGTAKLDHLGTALRPEDLNLLHVSERGAVCGPALYMAPETLRGAAKADIRSDLYSLGATLYEMLAGRPPHEGATAQEVLRKHVTEAAPDLRRARPEAPEALSQFVARLMARAPAERPQTAQQALDELRECAVSLSRRGQMEPVRAAVTPAEQKRSGAKWAAGWSVFAAVLVVAAVVPVVLMYRGCRSAATRPADADPHVPQRVAVVIGEGDPLLKDPISAEESLAVRTLIGQALACYPSLAVADAAETAELEQSGRATQEFVEQAGLKHLLVAAHSRGLGRRNWTLRFITPGSRPWSVSADCALDEGQSKGLGPLEQAMSDLMRKAAVQMKVPAAPLLPTGADATAWALLGTALQAEREDRWLDALSSARQATANAPRAVPFAALTAFYKAVDELRRTGKTSAPPELDPSKLPAETASLMQVLEEMDRGDRAGVEKQFADCLVRFPRSARGYFLLGTWRLYSEAQREDAAAAFKHASEIAPGYAPAVHAYAGPAERKTASDTDSR
jgi:hypothetical protein